MCNETVVLEEVSKKFPDVHFFRGEVCFLDVENLGLNTFFSGASTRFIMMKI